MTETEEDTTGQVKEKEGDIHQILVTLTKKA